MTEYRLENGDRVGPKDRGPYHENPKDKLKRRSKYIKESGCIEWTGATSDGYGSICVRKKNGKKGTIGTHRLSYQAYFGDIPQGMCVCHKCDNRKCVNPEHLFLGTHLDNAKDREVKGRGNHQIGEKCTAKLKEKQVVLIRKLYKHGILQKDIANRFGINPSTISYIITRKTWKHIK